MEVEITVLKFNEVSRRRELKRPTWFAVENDIFTHPDFFKVTSEELRCWLWMLSVASKLNKEVVRLDSEVFAHQCKCRENVFFSTIEKLKGKRLTVVASPSHDEIAAENVHYTTLHNNTEQNTTLQNSISTVAKQFAPVAVEKRSSEISFQNEHDLISSIPEITAMRWSRLYPDKEFLNRELLKAFGYYENNPVKKPKTLRGWIRALSSWFERGWVTYVKTIKPNPGSSINWQEVFKKGGLSDRV